MQNIAKTPAFEKQQSMISRASGTDPAIGRNTIISFRCLKERRTAALSHFCRILDYLERGDQAWYRLHDTAIEFLDGENEIDSRPEGPAKFSYR